MPIKPENRALYPKNLKRISHEIRVVRAQNRCERCGAENGKPHPVTGSKVVLTTAHLNHKPKDVRRKNLMAMCQKCHNNHDMPHRIANRKRTIDARNEQRFLAFMRGKAV